MFTLLTPYLGYIKVVAVAMAFAIIAAGVLYFRRHEQQIGYDKAVAEYTKKELAAEIKAREIENTLNVKLQGAQNAATERGIKINELSRNLNAATGKLRDTIATLRRDLPNSTPLACNQTADTVLAVFDDCQGKYTDMAEKADRHASDVKMLLEAH